MFRALKINFILFIFPLTLLSQVTVDNNVNLDNFPEIEISFNDRNPSVVNWFDVNLYELVDSTASEIELVSIEHKVNSTQNVSENKCVYILLEALHSENRYEQIFTFHRALLESLEEFVNEGDLIKIATFSLKDEFGNILNSLNDSFTDNESELYSAINALEVENTAFTNKGVSDLYGAGLEAIEEISGLNSTLPKTILLLSEERNNKYATQKSSSQLVNRAKELDVVLNTIKYNRSGYHQYTDPTLADYTYGERVVLPASSGNLEEVNYEKLELAKVAISRVLNDFTSSVLGNNYVISATLNHAVDNGAVSELIVEGLSPEKYTLEFISPGNFITYSYREHTIVAIVVTLIILLLLFLTYSISVKKVKEQRLKKINQVESDKEFQTKISKQNDNIESLLNEQKIQKQKEQKAKADSLLVEQEERLIVLMKNSGGFPVLKSSEFIDDNFIVNKPVVSVGRDQSNLLCIPNQNISSKHFEIRFDKGNYKIFDKNSLNGVLVNGRKIKDCVLNNGDIITIADVAITFYL